MIVITAIAALREHLARRAPSADVAFVPTMGALHEGHGRLIDVARESGGVVVVSIFVNPLQFDREQDLRAYPRTLDADLAFCAERSVDVVFAPDAAEMYPQPLQCSVEVGRLADHLCGKHRPGHFRGVATVVMKLFQIVQPGRAYFGEKDAQQLAIIRRVVRDLDVPTTVVGVPTVREADGLAVSSRNRLLTTEGRRAAPALYEALREAERQIAAGVRDVAAITRAAVAHIPADPLLRLEYFEVVDPDEMQPVAEITGPVTVAAALWVGAVRLIDNVLYAPGSTD